MSDAPFYPYFYQSQASTLFPEVHIEAAQGVGGLRIASVFGSVSRRYLATNFDPSAVGSVEFDGAIDEDVPSHVQFLLWAPDRSRILHSSVYEIPPVSMGGLPPGGHTLPGQVAQGMDSRSYTEMLVLKNAANGGLEGQVLPGFPGGVKFAPISIVRVLPSDLDHPTDPSDPIRPSSVRFPCEFREFIKDPVSLSGRVRAQGLTLGLAATVQIELLHI